MERKFFYMNETKTTSTGNRLIEFIEKDPYLFVKLNISELADKVYISKSSISKITRSLGFNSFKNLQNWISHEMAYMSKDDLTDNATSLEDVSKNINLMYKWAAKRTLSDIDLKAFYKIKRIFKNKKQVLTFGIGSSSLAAIELAHSLNILGISSYKVDTINDVFQNINQNNKSEKCLVIYSRDLKNYAISQIRSILSKYNVDIIIFTANQYAVESKSETIVRFRTIKQKNRIVALSSKISQLLLTDIFINWYGKSTKNKIYQDFEKKWI